ncbi:hypothetical protein NPX13_g5778 [Xylaria arbuscula]|uniref:Uncharacterized protein n=1 Tax=Xylaria arbuscula TaxID=114810 RepID=A0A9W8NDU7_9PEZI|nr:hypothetical protein NPX13_g5778 [Xylaria arbuscula]
MHPGEFSASIRAPLLETGLLERFRLHHDDWQHSDRLWADQLFHDYIQFRIRKGQDRPPDESYYSHWNKTAVTYCQLTETQISIREIIDKLCWMILKPNACNWRSCNLSAIGELRDKYGYEKPRPWKPDMNHSQSSLELLSIAAYLNDVRLAEHLLCHYRILPWDSLRFNSPIYLAAYAGNTATFNLFKEYAIKSEPFHRFGVPPPGYPNRQPDLAFKDAFLGACEGGSLEMLQLALSLLTIQGTDLGSTQQTEGSEREIQMLTEGHGITSSVEIYKYLDSLREKPEYSVLKHTLPECLTLEDVLKAQYRRGNGEIVRHILDQYPDMARAKETHSGGKRSFMLARACAANYEDIVDIFLEKGGVPNEPSILREASRAGSVAIVRKLLDHGAVTDGWVIWTALMLEHESMVHVLLQNRPPIDADWKYKFLHNVKYRGLESMESLIRQSNQLMATPSELETRDAEMDSTKHTPFKNFLFLGIKKTIYRGHPYDSIRVRCAEPI